MRKASAAGEAVVYGDASRAQALTAAGLSRASAVVLTFLDVPLALHVLDQLRKLAPQIPVVVRTQDDRNLDALRAVSEASRDLDGTALTLGTVLTWVFAVMAISFVVNIATYVWRFATTREG